MSIEGVSVIICCYNSGHLLRPTLEHLAIQKVDAELNWEVIVVDNNSSDDTAEVAQSTWNEIGHNIPFSVVFEPKPGLMNARLKGLATAKYDYLVFVDDDNSLEEKYVQTVFDIFDSYPEVAVCGGDSMARLNMSPPNWWEACKIKFAVGKQGEKEGFVSDKKNHLWGAGLAIRRSVFLKLQEAKFNFILSDRKGKELSAGGDTELCYALKLKGHKLWYSPRLQLYHCIENKRLNYNYVIKMSRGIGQAQAGLSLYRAFFNEEKNITTFFQKQVLKLLFRIGKRIPFLILYVIGIERYKVTQQVAIAFQIGYLTALLEIGQQNYKKRYNSLENVFKEDRSIKSSN